MPRPSWTPTRRDLFRGAALGAGTVGAVALTQGRALAAPAGLSTGQCSITNNPDLSASAKMGLVILLPHEARRIPAIKAANPSTKVFVYKNLGAVSRAASGSTLNPSVVTTEQVRANPGWALHDNRGSTIYWTDFGGHLQPIDPGDPGVIAASVQGLIGECRSQGFDGVYLDDVNSDWGHANTGASAPVDFTGGSVMASTTAWVQQAAPRLRAAGLQVVANAQFNYNTWSNVLGAWSPHLDGVMIEHWSRWGDYSSSQWPNFTGDMWDVRRRQVDLVQSNGAYVIGLSFGDAWDTAGMRYHRATFLLLTGGRGYSMWTPSHFQGSYDQPAALTDLGASTSGAVRLSNGLWKRSFERGFVIVNPTGSAQGGTAASAGLGSSTAWVSIGSGDALIQRW